MSNFNDANELASNLVFGTNYHDNKPSIHHPKKLVFSRTTYVTITADAHTDEEWRKVSGEIEDVLNEGYWLDCNATLATSPLDDMDTAYTLDNLERLDFKPFDLRPETEEELYYEQARLADEEHGEPCHCEKCMKFYLSQPTEDEVREELRRAQGEPCHCEKCMKFHLSQATEDEVREELRRAQAEPVPSRQWFTELKAKFHSKEGIRQLAIEHANDPIDEVEDL